MASLSHNLHTTIGGPFEGPLGQSSGRDGEHTRRHIAAYAKHNTNPLTNNKNQ